MQDSTRTVGSSRSVADRAQQLYYGVYMGIVKDNSDVQKMGRLRVFIPELGKRITDEDNWFTVSYCSPFAGSTPMNDVVKGGKKDDETQKSYGFWAVPPDVDNEVVVMFLNGDPSRGIWIGGLYQQYKNFMVPGIASAQTHQGQTCGKDGPAAEYNSKDDSIRPPDPVRPRYTPLHEGLFAQGLYKDPERGTTTASARRASVSHVYGMSSPRGQQMYIDDDEKNEYIRIRTRGGAQVLVHETKGYVYINSKKGKSWIEIGDNGIDVYSERSISMRSQRDINFMANGYFNVEANAIRMRAVGGDGIQMEAVNGPFKARAQETLNLESSGSSHWRSGAGLHLGSNGELSLTSGGDIPIMGSKIFLNTAAGTAPEPSVRFETYELEDRPLSPPCYEPASKRPVIVSRMPTHEPWGGHQAPSASSQEIEALSDTSSKGYAGSSGETSTQGRSQTGGSGGSSGGGSNSPSVPKKGAAGATAQATDSKSLAAVSHQFESGGRGDLIHKDNNGAYAYGRYQLNAKSGNVDGFMKQLQKDDPDSYAKLQAAGGTEAMKRGDPEFQKAYKEVANTESFQKAEDKFFENKYYAPVAGSLDAKGYNISGRDPAVQQALMSMSIQHGPGGAERVMDNAMAANGVKDPSQLTDEQLIRYAYQERRNTDKYFPSSSPSLRENLKTGRFTQEEQVVLANLRKNQAAGKTG